MLPTFAGLNALFLKQGNFALRIANLRSFPCLLYKKRFAMSGFPLYNRERTCLPITIAKIT